MPPLYVIYCRPREYPIGYLCRIWNGLRTERYPYAIADTLEAMRAMLPEGLYCLKRNPWDDPVIVECWI